MQITVTSNELMEILHEYSKWLGGFWDRSTDSSLDRAKQFLQKQGYIPDDQVKLGKEEMLVAIGPIPDNGHGQD